GERVELTADPLDRTVDLALPVAGGPLEEHVLDPVRGAGDPRLLVLRTDPVPHPDARGRARVLRGQEDPKPVRKRERPDLWPPDPRPRHRTHASARRI